MIIEIGIKEYPALNAKHFHLKDKSCKAQVKGNYITLKTDLDKCKTAVDEKKDTITYHNYVRAFEIITKAPGETITREDDLTLPFNCTYKRQFTVLGSTSFEPKRRLDVTEGEFISRVKLRLIDHPL